MNIKRSAAKVLFRMGYALLHVQSTDKAVKFAMQVVLPKEEGLLLRLFGRLDVCEWKKLLGHFLTTLRSRAERNADVDNVFGRFLAHRNTFVHSLGEVPAWNL